MDETQSGRWKRAAGERGYKNGSGLDQQPCVCELAGSPASTVSHYLAGLSGRPVRQTWTMAVQWFRKPPCRSSILRSGSRAVEWQLRGGHSSSCHGLGSGASGRGTRPALTAPLPVLSCRYEQWRNRLVPSGRAAGGNLVQAGCSSDGVVPHGVPRQREPAAQQHGGGASMLDMTSQCDTCTWAGGEDGTECCAPGGKGPEMVSATLDNGLTISECLSYEQVALRTVGSP